MAVPNIKSIIENKKRIVLLIVVAAIAIMGICLAVSVNNQRPHEIDAPYGPEPFDFKSLKTSISMTPEEPAAPVVDEMLEMDY